MVGAGRRAAVGASPRSAKGKFFMGSPHSPPGTGNTALWAWGHLYSLTEIFVLHFFPQNKENIFSGGFLKGEEVSGPLSHLKNGPLKGWSETGNLKNRLFTGKKGLFAALSDLWGAMCIGGEAEISTGDFAGAFFLLQSFFISFKVFGYGEKKHYCKK